MNITAENLTEEAVDDALRKLSMQGMAISRRMFDLVIEPMNQAPLVFGTPRWVWGRLLVNCQLTSETSYLLIGHRRLWDCELLVRSLFEGSFRLQYLTNGTNEQQEQRADEYWSILPEMDRLKKHARVSKVLDNLSDSNTTEWNPLKEMKITNEEADEIRQKYDRKTRKKMAQKWSFGELAKTMESETGFPFSCLQYSYGMSSHLIHQDADAIGMVWDRVGRSDSRRLSVELCHGCRLIQDTLAAAQMRSDCCLKSLGKNILPNDITSSVKELVAICSQYTALWHAIEFTSEENS